jgi:hypothetical protein
MFRKVLPLLICLTLIMMACNFSATPAFIPTNTAGISLSVTETFAPAATNTAQIPSDTPQPANTTTLTPTNTPAPAVTDTVIPVPVNASTDYIDDRSTPSQLIVSLYNAIDRREYLRAYDYWDDPANTLGDYNAYAAGYQETASVDLVFGQITGEPGMSQVYYTVPVILKATDTHGVRTNYAACYVVHSVSAGVLGGPPFIPMSIYNGSAVVSDLHASDASLLATTCQAYPQGSSPVAVEGAPLEVDKSNFLDNRSGPVETVSSMLNALNSREYVRAYSYFQNPGSYPGPYAAYEAGYADTDTITVTFGVVQSEGAAGSLYYKLPTALYVVNKTTAAQTFVGCYTLRLTNPSVQGAPPFQPMGIISGKFLLVVNGTDIHPLLPTACN